MHSTEQDTPKIDFKKALGLSDSAIQGMYGQAHRFYSQGKYTEALDLFRLLVLIENKEIKYSMGVGACLQMKKEYAAALQVYLICGTLDPHDPKPHYHAADCHIQSGDRFAAVVALEMAVSRAGNRKEYTQLKERAQLLIASLRGEMTRLKTL